MLYPFSIEELRIAYNHLGSYDSLIQACEAARQAKETSVLHYAKIISQRKFGPSETK